MISNALFLVCLIVFMRTRDTAYLICAGLFWVGYTVFLGSRALCTIADALLEEEEDTEGTDKDTL